MDEVKFEKVSLKHKDIIFQWLAEPHMQEFWDNSQEHKDDIFIFMNGRKEESPYFNGIFSYWIGSIEEETFCFILTAKVVLNSDCPEIWKKYISKADNTYSIDFGIGNIKYWGKGLASQTLETFINFFHDNIDVKADTFFIDPDTNNPKAKHVYENAGFQSVGQFKSERGYWDFSGDLTYLMIKKLPPR